MKEQWVPTIGDEVVHLVTRQRAKITAFGLYERSAVLYTYNHTGGFHFDVANIFEWKLDNSSCTSPTPLTLTSQEEITKPKRYNKKGKLECWDVILDQEMNFLEGSIQKYLWRYKEKNGIHDLEKAKVYIDKLIEEIKKNEK